MDWLLFTILAMIFYGIQGFLYKTSAVKKEDPITVTFWMMLTVTLFSLLFNPFSFPLSTTLILLSIFNSITFLTLIVFRLYLLRKLQVNVVYPILNMEIILTVLIGLLFSKKA